MENWLKKKVEEFKDDFEFRLEYIILSITEKISKTMKKKNMSRSQLADRLNVSPPAVTKILNGSSNFTLKTLLSISDALNMEMVIDFHPKDHEEFSFDYEAAFFSSIEGGELPYTNDKFVPPDKRIRFTSAADSTSFADTEIDMSKAA